MNGIYFGPSSDLFCRVARLWKYSRDEVIQLKGDVNFGNRDKN